MPQDAPPNGSAPGGPWSRVAGMQAKLHRWAVADPGRRFDGLFNFVYDPATLLLAFERVATNQGANTPGVDGLTAAWVEENVGVPGFLDDLRAALKDGSFRPLPVRERKVPKPGGSGKLRKLGRISERVTITGSAHPAGVAPVQGSGSGIRSRTLRRFPVRKQGSVLVSENRPVFWIPGCGRRHGGARGPDRGSSRCSGELEKVQVAEAVQVNAGPPAVRVVPYRGLPG
jgi:hypothetical protein